MAAHQYLMYYGNAQISFSSPFLKLHVELRFVVTLSRAQSSWAKLKSFEFEFMYAVKVRGVRQNSEEAELSEEASRLATELLAEQALDTRGSSDQVQDEVSFSVGNPRVEHLTGKVHLYRQVSSDPFNHQLPVSSAPCFCQQRFCQASVEQAHSRHSLCAICRLLDLRGCACLPCHWTWGWLSSAPLLVLISRNCVKCEL